MMRHKLLILHICVDIPIIIYVHKGTILYIYNVKIQDNFVK